MLVRFAKRHMKLNDETRVADAAGWAVRAVAARTVVEPLLAPRADQHRDGLHFRFTLLDPLALLVLRPELLVETMGSRLRVLPQKHAHEHPIGGGDG